MKYCNSPLLTLFAVIMFGSLAFFSHPYKHEVAAYPASDNAKVGFMLDHGYVAKANTKVLDHRHAAALKGLYNVSEADISAPLETRKNFWGTK